MVCRERPKSTFASHVDCQLHTKLTTRPDHKPVRIDVVGVLFQKRGFQLFADKVDAAFSVEAFECVLEGSQLICGCKSQAAGRSHADSHPSALFLEEQFKGLFTELFTVEPDNEAVGSRHDLVTLNPEFAPGGAKFEQADEFAVHEVPDRHLNMVELPADSAARAEPVEGGLLMFKQSKAAKKLGKRSGMEARTQQPRDGFAVRSHSDRRERWAAIGKIQSPVLLEFPDGKAKDAGNEKDVEPRDEFRECNSEVGL
jgi:hypothetical protein